MTHSSTAEIHYFRIYCNLHDDPTWADRCRNQIGRWLVVCTAVSAIFGRSTAMCVVDDFGDLVGVPS